MANKIRKLLMSVSVFAISLGSLLAFSAPVALAAPAYDYQLITQSAYPATLAPGATTNVWIEVKNTGTATWKNTGSNVTRLGSGSAYGAANQQRDYSSEFANSDWPSANRAAAMLHPEIRPGWHTRFQFNIKAPTTAGTYKAYFTPVTDGLTWMKDIGIYWQLTVSGTTPSPDITIPPPSTGLNVALSSSSPAAGTIAKGASDVPMAIINFTAGSDSSKTISAIKVTKYGVAPDADVSNVKLFDGATQIGSTQGLSSSTATFSGLAVSIPAGTTKALTIKTTIAAAANAANTVAFGIAASADITGTVSPAGTFPITGSTKTIANLTAGTLTITNASTPGDASPVIGSADNTFAILTFTANNNEDIYLNSLALTRSGTSNDTDVANIKIFDGATQLGSTVASLTSTKATFNLSTPLKILAGGSKNITVKADVVASPATTTDTSGRTVNFGVNAVTDWSASGGSSGGGVIDGTAGYPLNGTAQTMQKGTLTTTVDATTPSAANYVKGTSDKNFAIFRLTAGSREDVKVTQIKITRTTNSADTDLNSIKLFDGTTQIGGTANLSSNIATFAGLSLIVPKGNYKLLTVKASISTGATATNTPKLTIGNAATDIEAQGMTSNIKVTDASGVLNTTNVMTVTAVGTMTVSLSSASLATSTLVLGSTDIPVATFNLQAGTGEDVTVTALTIQLQRNGAAAAAGNFTNVKLFDSATQVGSTVANPTSSAAFAPNLTVAAGTTKSIVVKVDIPVGGGFANTDTARARLLAVTNAADMTSSGVSSGQAITEAGDATGNTMTIGTGALSVAMGSTPVAANVVKNSSDVTVATVLLTAGTAEDIRVTSLKIQEVGSAVAADTANIKLFDGATQLGQTAAVFDADANGTVTFDLSSIPLTVTKGTTKSLAVKLSVNAGATATNVIEVTVMTTGIANQVVSTGITTGASITETGGSDTNVPSRQTIATSGTLTALLDAGSPVSAQVVANISGVEVARYKFTASNHEDIKISMLKLDKTAGAASDFSLVKLYDGATQVGSDGYVIDAGTDYVTFNLATGSEVIVPKNSTKVITVKANINAVGSGVTSGSAPVLRIGDNNNANDINYITAQGASSGVTLGIGDLAGTAAALNELSNAMNLYKTKLTISKSSSSPSGSLIPGVTEVIRLDLVADSAGDVTFRKNTDALRFTFAQAGGAVAVKATSLYKSDGTALDTTPTTSVGADQAGVDYTTASPNNYVTYDFDSPAGDTVIGAGTTLTVYVTADLADYATVGESIRFDVPQVATQQWYDGTAAVADSLTKNLPITGGTLVKP